jgi:galactose mutarotase-like enzyme
MNAAAAARGFQHTLQGFSVYELKNEELSLAVVPELGAKVISLKNLRTGREWMWRPPGELRLFRNQIGDDFANSAMVGWDECLPTIEPCIYKGRELTDHGEAWALPWSIDETEFERGVLKTSVNLPISPFYFERTITLSKNVVRVGYRLENRNNQPEAFLWSMHALLPVFENGEIEVTRDARWIDGNPKWLKTLRFEEEPGFSKLHAGPLSEGNASVRDRTTGEGIHLSWNVAVNPMLGVWLTRGGWNGYHHLAIEPTNGAADSLPEAMAHGFCHGTLMGNETRLWWVTLRVDGKLDDTSWSKILALAPMNRPALRTLTRRSRTC